MPNECTFQLYDKPGFQLYDKSAVPSHPHAVEQIYPRSRQVFIRCSVIKNLVRVYISNGSNSSLQICYVWLSSLGFLWICIRTSSSGCCGHLLCNRAIVHDGYGCTSMLMYLLNFVCLYITPSEESGFTWLFNIRGSSLANPIKNREWFQPATLPSASRTAWWQWNGLRTCLLFRPTRRCRGPGSQTDFLCVFRLTRMPHLPVKTCRPVCEGDDFSWSYRPWFKGKSWRYLLTWWQW